MKRGSSIRYLIFGLSLLYGIGNLGNGSTLRAQEGNRRIASGDSARITLLLDKSSALQFQAPDSAMALAREALSLSRRQQYNRGIALSLILMSSYVHNAGKNESYKSLIFEALPYCYGSSMTDLLPIAYNGIGSLYFEQSAFDSASYFFFLALGAFEAQKTKDSGLLASVYLNLGGNFSNMGQHDQALYYMKKSIDLNIQRKDTGSLAFAYYDIGNASINAGKTDSAIKYLDHSLYLYQYLKKKQWMPVQKVYTLLGYAWTNKGDWSKANFYYDSAIAIDKTRAEDNYIIYQGKGRIYYLEGHYKKAILYIKHALEICKRQGLRQAKLNTYELLASNYEKLDDYKKSHYYLNCYIFLQDSLMNEKMLKTVNQLEVKYRATAKDKELVKNKLQLALAQNRLSKSNSWTMGIIMGALILVITTVIIVQKQRLQLQKAKVAEQLQRVEQLKAVFDGEEKERSRIGRQLHDDIMVELSIVKMGLNALPVKFPVIKGTEDYTNVVQQLNRTSQKLRQSAHNLMPDALLTEGLTSAISYFCSNITKMTGLRIHLQHYGVPPRLPADIEISIYRIIQELVQNIIKHAQATYTLVQLNYRGNILSITVEDDGVGFDPKHNDNENKMGLKSIQTRLKALNGIIDIHECKPHGTSVNISLAIGKSDDKNQTL